jgi:hypothetical protein
MGTGHRYVALTVGSRALGAFEPRQVRKEAALRTPSQVPRHRPTRAGGGGTTRDRLHDDGARDRALTFGYPGARVRWCLRQAEALRGR